MDYHTTTDIHPSLEPWHNNGLSPEETNLIIREELLAYGLCFARVDTPVRNHPNWIIKVGSGVDIEYLMDSIEFELNEALAQKHRGAKKRT